MGTWIQIAALNWLVYRIGGSTRDLGLVSAAAALPLIPFSLLGGTITDRYSKKKVLLVTQSLLMLQALALTIIVFLGITRVWHVMILSAVLGAVTAMDHPARQSFIVDILEQREDLRNAIALNATLFNLARTVGPAIAGILVAMGGESTAFLVNTLSYLAALGAIATIRWKRDGPPPPKTSMAHQLIEGLKYSHNHIVVREILGLIAVSAFFAMSFMMLMPAFAKDILGADPKQYGFLFSCVGLGAVIGGLIVASLPLSFRPGRLFPFGFLAFPLLVIAFSQTQTLASGMALMLLVGISFVVQNSLANTILQSSIRDDFRGRVMSLYSLIFQGAFRMGVLFTGELARHTGVATALAIGGFIALLYSLRLLARGANFWGVAPREIAK